jgi:hypothetical protein
MDMILESKIDKVNVALATMVQQGMAQYGINYQISTDTVTRIGTSVGMVANANGGQNNFDSIMPWSGMRRCNLADDGKTVNNYYGDTNYKEDGSNGQVMVEIPAFYYSRVLVNSDNINTYVSMLPLTGFKLHPWFCTKAGVVRTKAYFSAYEGSAFSVATLATEVDTLTVTAPCTTAGNLIIKLDQYNLFNVAVLTTDNTTALVAIKINTTVYAGWTTSIAGSVVTFTCNTTGLTTTAIIVPGTTGVTATIVKTTTGAGGYVANDAQAVNFTATTGDKLCSVAGMKPISGLTQATHIVNCRNIANNRGTGWEQQHFNASSAIQMLLIVEYGSLNSQAVIGQGVVNVADDGLTNQSVITGATSSLGNKSGKATGTDGLVSVSYRGVENFWGNIWKWVDGFNINNGVSYISNVNGNFVSNIFTGQYIATGFANANANGYVSSVGLNVNFDYGFIPTVALGTSTSKYADYFFQNSSGSFGALLGAGWNNGAYAGAFYWFLINGSGYYVRSVGARLCA